MNPGARMTIVALFCTLFLINIFNKLNKKTYKPAIPMTSVSLWKHAPTGRMHTQQERKHNTHLRTMSLDVAVTRDVSVVCHTQTDRYGISMTHHIRFS